MSILRVISLVCVIAFSVIGVGCGSEMSEEEVEQSKVEMEKEIEDLQEQLPADL